MAFLKGCIKSEVMHMDNDLAIILPHDRIRKRPGKPIRVLYLLHGLSGNFLEWSRYTALERYTREYELCVVMPSVQRSFYTDMKYGLPYYTFISEELPRLMKAMFGISADPKDTFIAGCSMGGYGALKMLMRNPENYGGAAAFSSAVDLKHSMLNEESRKLFPYPDITGVFGEKVEVGPEDDLYAIAENYAKLPQAKEIPIYASCGTEDFLYPYNVEFRKKMEELGINYHYEEWPGVHGWDFWDQSIDKALKYLLPNG